MPTRRVMRTAATASMVSSARTNRAVRKSIQGQQPSAPASVADPAPAAAPAQSDLAAKLEELNDLKNRGILTQEEFDAKKKLLLGI